VWVRVDVRDWGLVDTEGWDGDTWSDGVVGKLSSFVHINHENGAVR